MISTAQISLEQKPYMDLIHDGCELGVLVVLGIDRASRVLKVLDVFGVHLEEVRKLDHDVPDLLVLGVEIPLVHTVPQLQEDVVLGLETHFK